MQLEEYALKLNASDFACRSKAKAKPLRREPAGSSTRTIPIGERIWTDVEQGEYSISDYAVSKKFIHLLRHARLPREDDGAIEFWRIKDDLQKYFLHCHHWSDDKWKKSTAGNKTIYQYCTDSSGAILYLRALQGHSGRSLIDPILQNNVVIPINFFHYVYHVGCAINLHFIINSGLIFGGQILGNRQTGEVIYEKVYASPRPPPKISLKHDWMKELGSEAAQRPDGQVVQQFKSSQLNQPNPNPDHDDRTEKPVVGRDANHEPGAPQTRSSDDSKSFNIEDKTAHDRTVQPVVVRDTHHEPGNEQSMLNEGDIDFRIPGLPHSLVKHCRVRQLVKKIENHPHRHSLQRDLQQNEAYNPFSTMTKQMIQDVGNVELF